MGRRVRNRFSRARFLRSRFAVCVVGGIILCVSQGWCWSILMNPFEVDRVGVAEITASGRWWRVVTWTRIGLRRWNSYRSVSGFDRREGAFPGEALPYWSPFAVGEEDYSPSEGDGHRWLSEATGWPLLAFYWEGDDPREPEATIRWGFVTTLPPWMDGGNVGQPRIVPLHPIWSGLLVNSLVYGTILLLCIQLPVSTRRLRRRKRGLCLRCGYPLGQSLRCPECGVPTPGIPTTPGTTVTPAQPNAASDDSTLGHA